MTLSASDLPSSISRLSGLSRFSSVLVSVTEEVVIRQDLDETVNRTYGAHIRVGRPGDGGQGPSLTNTSRGATRMGGRKGTESNAPETVGFKAEGQRRRERLHAHRAPRRDH